MSFREELKKVAAQLELEIAIKGREPNYRLYQEMAMIVAEVNLMPEDTSLNISGEKVPVKLVKEIYRELTLDHIRVVADKLCAISYAIGNKKAFLRAMLYNIVFEIEVDAINSGG